MQLLLLNTLLSSLEIGYIFIGIFGFLLLLFILFLGIGELALYHLFSHKKMDQRFKKNIKNEKNPFNKLVDFDYVNNHPFSEIELKANDKIKLVSRLYKAKTNSHYYLISSHGYTGSHLDQTVLFHHLQDKYNLNLLLITQRGHGSSGGRYTTMGIKESFDLKLWVEHLKSLDQEAKILIFGSSFGAATALFTASDVSNELIGVIADAPFTSPYNEYKSLLSAQLKNLYLLELTPLYLSAKLLHGIDYKSRDLSRDAKKITCPVLITHGKNDRSVYPEHSEIIFNSLPKNPLNKRALYENGRHCLSAFYHKDEYYQEIEEFLNKILVS